MLQFDWNNGVLDVPAKLSVAVTHTVSPSTFHSLPLLSSLLSALYTSLSVGWFFAFSRLTLCGLFYVYAQS